MSECMAHITGIAMVSGLIFLKKELWHRDALLSVAQVDVALWSIFYATIAYSGLYYGFKAMGQNVNGNLVFALTTLSMNFLSNILSNFGKFA